MSSHDPDRTFSSLVGSFPRDWIEDELAERERHAFDDAELEEVAEWRKVVESLSDDELEQAHLNAGDEILDALPMTPARYLLDAATVIANRKEVTT